MKPDDKIWQRGAPGAYMARFVLTMKQLRNSLNMQYLSIHHPGMVNIPKGFMPRSKTDFLALFNLSGSEQGMKKLEDWDRHQFMHNCENVGRQIKIQEALSEGGN